MSEEYYALLILIFFVVLIATFLLFKIFNEKGFKKELKLFKLKQKELEELKGAELKNGDTRTDRPGIRGEEPKGERDIRGDKPIERSRLLSPELTQSDEPHEPDANRDEQESDRSDKADGWSWNNVREDRESY